MRVILSEPSGSQLDVTLEDTATLAHLKHRLQDQEGVPCYLQNYIYEDLPLTDNEMVLATLGAEVPLRVEYNLSGGGAKCETGECKCRLEVCSPCPAPFLLLFLLCLCCPPPCFGVTREPPVYGARLWMAVLLSRAGSFFSFSFHHFFALAILLSKSQLPLFVFCPSFHFKY
eukprot:TRINITY_DN753_c0_g1_i5.p1 TRINITY_DN753_c0_g1~~TRINITY_DN753_c0_g1_i5.p1  ORF type:complete len:172 (-),score=34.46 TRINITY_DN753_c0_g1_i5:74-589(-)